MSLQAVFPKGPVFRNLLEAIKDTLNDVELLWEPEGLRASSMDSVHVAFVAFRLPAADFALYDCPQTVPMGVAVHTLLKILKCCPDNQFVEIRAQLGGDVVLLKSRSAPDASPEAEFEVRLMDISAERIELPEFAAVANAKLVSADWKSMIDKVKEIGPSATIIFAPGKITLSTTGDIGSVALHKLTECTGDGTGVFSVKFLCNFAKATALSSQVSVRMTENDLVLFEYAVGKGGSILFCLAPTVDDIQAEKKQKVSEEES